MEYLFLAFIYNLLINKGGLFLRSKIDALKQIRIILNKRKQVQRGGKVSSHYLGAILNKRSLLKHLSGAL